ncbi:hypothetical protein VA249_45520 (plasmid) [Vibrio alfacsensis]|nr:hypothetical protein VA249_45520 [Vibrio alfacsensis]
MHVKLNALNHKIHESIICSVNKKEAINHADSLSIKESLTALSSFSINADCNKNISMIYTKVEPLLSVTLQDYEALAVKYGINFISDFSADRELRTIKFDPSKLNKIVSIILSNAVSVSERGDSIKVSTSITKEKYVIAITDSKGGIKSNVVDKLNDVNITSMGRRVDCHNRVHYGLGLISLKNLIIDSGIDVRSRTIDKYHTFYIEIYRYKATNKVSNFAN